MEFRPLTREDKTLFDNWFQRMQPKISEFTFTNLYIWQHAQKLVWCPWKEGAILMREENKEMVFLPPVGFEDCERVFLEVIQLAKDMGVKAIVRIPEWAKRFLPKGGRLVPQREHFDYVYRAIQLAELKGWRLDGKRAFVRKFREAYPNWRFELYHPGFREGCERLLSQWVRERKGQIGVKEEYEAIKSLLEQKDLLGCKGGVLLVGGKVVALSFGEKLSETTFVVHFEKADTTFIGSYQMINQQMAQNIIAPSYLFVNREQDLGIEGLRKAKKSYAPLKLVKKYCYEIVR